MDNGWTDISIPPIADESNQDVPILVWHEYQGVMTVTRGRAARNPFFTHWREIDSGAWISVAHRKPTRQDADIQNCVISLDRWGNIRMAGWHRFEHEAHLIGWQRPPDPPTRKRIAK